MKNLKGSTLGTGLFLIAATLAVGSLSDAHAKNADKKRARDIHKAIKNGDCKQSDHCKIDGNGKGTATAETTNNGDVVKKSGSSYKEPEGGTTTPGRNY